MNKGFYNNNNNTLKCPEGCLSKLFLLKAYNWSTLINEHLWSHYFELLNSVYTEPIVFYFFEVHSWYLRTGVSKEEEFSLGGLMSMPMCGHSHMCMNELSTQRTQRRPTVFVLLKYQQGMPYSKQKGRVKWWASMSLGLNYYVLLPSSTPLSLWFQVWHQSVSCRVAGTGSTRQQLPVCSAEGYASQSVVGCQQSPESESVHKPPQWLGLPPWGLSASSILKTDPCSFPKIAKLM